DIRKLRSLVAIDQHAWNDDHLHRLTDEFAVYLGFAIKAETSVTSAEHFKRVRQRILAPAEHYLRSLSDPVSRAEYARPWKSSMRGIDLERVMASVQNHIDAINDHLSQIKLGNKRGKRPDTDLNKYFAEMVELFAADLNPGKRPTRIWLEPLADLLANPL